MPTVICWLFPTVATFVIRPTSTVVESTISVCNDTEPATRVSSPATATLTEIRSSARVCRVTWGASIIAEPLMLTEVLPTVTALGSENS